MRILLVGSGGREHSLAWKISRSPLLDRLIWAPGNGGRVPKGEAAAVSAGDVRGIVTLAKERRIDLVVVGPEAPLAEGLADTLAAEGIRCFGPSAAAARLESSKAFTKEFCIRQGIDTADYSTYTSADEAYKWLSNYRGVFPVVLKADGLAAGKGVLICEDIDAAREGIEQIMVRKEFGDAGDRLVVEEFLDGEEVSLFCFSDGESILPMPPARDYKKALDGDGGLNTGGMGAFSPTSHVTPERAGELVDSILRKTVTGMAAEGHPFRGVLYAGLMLKGETAKLLEFNCRFGDPETQVVLPRLECDILPILLACAEGGLDRVDVTWKPQTALTVVLCSEGYPGSYEKGKEITGLPPEDADDLVVFHAGTRREGDLVFTNGGRVLNVTALGDDLATARERAYGLARSISFEGVRFRSDIGA